MDNNRHPQRERESREMAKHIRHWQHTTWKVGLVIALGLLLAACNLGQQAPSEPVTQTPAIGGVPQEVPGVDTGLTATPLIQVPPTNTPPPDLLPSERLGPITVDGTAHRAQELVTVRVRRGTAVSTVTCSWVLQDTNQTGTLGTPTTNPIDADTAELVYSFTPQAAGTYAVNCTGVALTASGQRAVSAAGMPFAVEAKG